MKTFGKIQVAFASALIGLALCGCGQQSDTTNLASTNNPSNVNAAPAVVSDTSATNSISANQPPSLTPMPDASQATTNAPPPTPMPPASQTNP
jgi:hypothetical protein